MYETLALATVVLALAAGAGLGAYRAFQSPVFYAALINLIWEKLAPELLKIIAKDFTPEHAAKVAESVRTGQPIESRHRPRHKGER